VNVKVKELLLKSVHVKVVKIKVAAFYGSCMVHILKTCISNNGMTHKSTQVYM